MGNLINILMGRQLSGKKMEKARIGKRKEFLKSMNFAPSRGDYYNVYIDENKIVERIAIYEISEGDCAGCSIGVCSVEVYNLKTVAEKIYNRIGLLEQKTIVSFSSKPNSKKIITYDSQENLFGKIRLKN